MRFAKQKGGAGALEAHHERTKEKYASTPDINTERSKYNKLNHWEERDKAITAGYERLNNTILPEVSTDRQGSQDRSQERQEILVRIQEARSR